MRKGSVVREGRTPERDAMATYLQPAKGSKSLPERSLFNTMKHRADRRIADYTTTRTSSPSLTPSHCTATRSASASLTRILPVKLNEDVRANDSR